MQTRSRKRRRLDQSYNNCHWVSMSTKQSITQAQASSEPNKRAVWSTQEEQALVSALSERKAQAGDGMNFKPAVWNAIAAEVGSVKGAAKTGDICKTKWGRVSHLKIQLQLP